MTNTGYDRAPLTTNLTELDWEIRLHIYRSIVEHGRAPSVDETAVCLELTPDEARQSYHRLQRPHQIVLEPGADTIRMAIPLSAILTAHRVWIDGRLLYANCAWDSLGVAAMLNEDATIEAPSGTGDSIRYSIENGSVVAPNDLSIHFPLPFWRWFDNIVST